MKICKINSENRFLNNFEIFSIDSELVIILKIIKLYLNLQQINLCPTIFFHQMLLFKLICTKQKLSIELSINLFTL